MGNRATLLFLLLVICCGFIAMANGSDFYKENRQRGPRGRGEEGGGEEEEPPRRRGRGDDRFLLQDSKHVVQTDAGDMRVVRTFGGSGRTSMVETPMHIGFITMEPNSLFIPQYLDSNLIIFIRRGEAKIGLIYRDELGERRLKNGDIYRIPAGSAFYLVNPAEGQRLHIVCSIDRSPSWGFGTFQSFFIGGGTYPTSILAGFEPETLSTAFNVTMNELRDIMTLQNDGPIVYLDKSRSPKASLWKKFLKMKEQDKLKHLKKMMNLQQASVEEKEEEEEATWSWRKLVSSVLGLENGNKKRETKGRSPDSYNIYRKPDFKNNYGSSIAIDDTNYDPLKGSGICVYFVNLTAGSMMAPHVNPRATEYGIVLRGTGIIQIVYPNGTQAMSAKVAENDVFWIPRFFPFCQIASRTGPFEFFGFTTSSEKNRPQFLAGANSVLTTLSGPELAASFGLNEERVKRFVNSQREAIILPSASASPPDKLEEQELFSSEKVKTLTKTFDDDMVMGFD